MGENILWSIRVATDDWKANVIRLPVHDTFWFGCAKGQAPGTEEEYRQLVDKAVRLVAGKGAYLVLDLHRFGAPTEKDVAFWKHAAARYKNNPAVLFRTVQRAARHLLGNLAQRRFTVGAQEHGYEPG